MKTTIFDGKKFAKEKKAELKARVKELKKAGISPKLVSILIGDDPASLLYISLKKKKAQEVGCLMEVKRFGPEADTDKLIRQIKLLNRDSFVHGIMIQLPLPGNLRKKTSYILETIALGKDVDGLRGKSPFVSATLKAVLQIIKVAKKAVGHNFGKVVVVGASGTVGKPLIGILRRSGYKVTGYNTKTKNLKLKTKKADLLIGTTGSPGLIKKDMVKYGAVVIDVGSPKGDVDPSVSPKASFFTPVPGGVGPATIVCLLENLVIAAGKSI